MKKILSVLFAVMLAAGLLTMSASAVGIVSDTTSVADKEIKCFDYLDFSDVPNEHGVSNNQWAVYNSETGKWEPAAAPINRAYYGDDGVRYPLQMKENENGELRYLCYNPETKVYDDLSEDDFWDKYTDESYGASLETSQPSAKSWLSHLEWSLVEDGEVLSLKAIDTNATPAISFAFDDAMLDVPLGTEASGNTQYCKMRIRNYSSSNQFTFGWYSSQLNGGGAFMQNSIATVSSTLDVAVNSGEWATYQFSMSEINSNTNYAESLALDSSGTPSPRWLGKLRFLLIFPFGYSVTDGTGSYKGAQVDIDYIVLGSKSYVESYKSALEIKEESVSSVELVKAPDKVKYYVGDSIDLTGLQLKATYKDGSTDILENCNAYCDLSTAASKTTVSLKYGTASASYDVEVIGIDKIEVATEPTETTYDAKSVASGFSAPGLTLNVSYVDGYVREGFVPSADNISISALTVGEQIVTVNYFGSKLTFKVNIINVVGIKIEPVTKKLYYGTELTLDDLTVTCVYSDDSEKTLADADIAPIETITYDTKTPGEITVTLKLVNETYAIDVTGTTTATVETPVSLEITNAPDKTTYGVDEAFDATGMKVSYVYDGGHKSEVATDDYKLSYDFSAPSDAAEVTVTAGGLTAKLEAVVDGSVVVPTSATKAPASSTDKPGENNGSPVVIIVIIVAVVVIAGVVVFIVLKKKAK